MDEIVFEFRNKNYGAYILRRLYNRHLAVSLLLAIFLLCAGLCYPFISGFYADNGGRNLMNDEGVVLVAPPSYDKVVPPPLPPPDLIVEKLVFRVPKVVEGEVPEDANINQDDFSRNIVNAPVSNDEPPSPATAPVILDIQPDVELHYYVEEMPSFVGGEEARYKFLAGNLVYPQMAKENNIQGTVYVSFIIDARGHIANVKILRGIGGGCDEEAIRVIGMMPDWNAGRQNGRTVNVSFNMPIVFKLAN